MISFFFVILAHPVIQRSIATKDLSASTNSPLERGRGVLECIELCILRFAHDTPPAPSLEGSSLAYCHSERSEESEKRWLMYLDPSLHSVSLWMTREGEGICTPWRNTSRCKQENVVLRPIERRSLYTTKIRNINRICKRNGI